MNVVCKFYNLIIRKLIIYKEFFYNLYTFEWGALILINILLKQGEMKYIIENHIDLIRTKIQIVHS